MLNDLLLELFQLLLREDLRILYFFHMHTIMTYSVISYVQMRHWELLVVVFFRAYYEMYI
jgi:hypothetical protein